MTNTASSSSKRTTTRRKAAKPAPPLTTDQQKLLKDVTPLVRGIANQQAQKWEADAEELQGQAAIYAAEAVRDFDGRGNIRGFVRCRVKQRLIDNLRHECSGKVHVQSSIYHLRHGPRRFQTDPSSRSWDRRARQLRDDPSFPLRLAEAVAAVRGCLSSRDIEILRLITSGMDTKAVASEIHLAQRTVQLALAAIRRRIDREVTESGLPKREIVTALLRDDPVVRARAMMFLGYPAEEISKN